MKVLIFLFLLLTSNAFAQLGGGMNPIPSGGMGAMGGGFGSGFMGSFTPGCGSSVPFYTSGVISFMDNGSYILNQKNAQFVKTENGKNGVVRVFYKTPVWIDFDLQKTQSVIKQVELYTQDGKVTAAVEHRAPEEIEAEKEMNRRVGMKFDPSQAVTDSEERFEIADGTCVLSRRSQTRKDGRTVVNYDRSTCREINQAAIGLFDGQCGKQLKAVASLYANAEEKFRKEKKELKLTGQNRGVTSGLKYLLASCAMAGTPAASGQNQPVNPLEFEQSVIEGEGEFKKAPKGKN